MCLWCDSQLPLLSSTEIYLSITAMPTPGDYCLWCVRRSVRCWLTKSQWQPQQALTFLLRSMTSHATLSPSAVQVTRYINLSCSLVHCITVFHMLSLITAFLKPHKRQLFLHQGIIVLKQQPSCCPLKQSESSLDYLSVTQVSQKVSPLTLSFLTLMSFAFV